MTGILFLNFKNQDSSVTEGESDYTIYSVFNRMYNLYHLLSFDL